MEKPAKKQMSLKTKIAGAVAILALLGAIATLVIILATGNDKKDTNTDSPDTTQTEITDLDTAVQNLPSPEALNFILAELDGYWISGSQFVRFSSQTLEYGRYATSYGVHGDIEGAEILGEHSFTLTLFIPARPTTEMDDASPERTEIINVDISTFRQDGRLSIQIPFLADGEWQTYEYNGKSL